MKKFKNLDDCKEQTTNVVNKVFYANIGIDNIPFFILDLFDFLLIYDKLKSKGYTISDGNAEEEYIKIIEQDDDALSQMLETFLEKKEKVEKYVNFNNERERIVDAIKISESEQEVLKQAELFLKKYSFE